MQAKVELLEHMIADVYAEDAAAIEDLREATVLRDEYLNAYGGDVTDVTGDAKIFKEQIDSLRSSDLATLYSDLKQHKEATSERAALFDEWMATIGPTNVDDFRINLLKHLAGNIIVKEHRIRY